MFSIAGSNSVTMPSLKHTQVSSGRISGLKLVLAPSSKASFPLRRSLQVCCAAKPETMKKVISVVREQLDIPKDEEINGESTFADNLGADSLDTVEIMLGLEEAFGIDVADEAAQKITTVQEAADLVQTLISEE